MATLPANGRAITRAINDLPATYAIKRHDRLYLDVRGEGRAAWRIRYRPRPNANQRWFTLSEDAAHADFEEISRKASELGPTRMRRGNLPLFSRRRMRCGV